MRPDPLSNERADEPTSSRVDFRDAEPGDSSDLAVLADAATRRLVWWLWDSTTETGQSSFEVGRSIILSEQDHLSHHSRWRVAQRDGRVVGGLNSYRLAVPPEPSSANIAEVVRPLNELKAKAEGSWYVSVASVFPEFRGQGAGKAILREAEGLAAAAGIGQLSLMVASFNPRAKSLYERFGMSERARQPFVAFPGSGERGDWILMVKDLR